MNIPKDGYRICLIDPPWKYDNEKSNDPAMGGMTYSTLNQKDLCSINFKDIMHKDSLMFCWATLPKLPEAIEFIESQGFKYITAPFVWFKINPTGKVVNENNDVILKKGIYKGLGHYTQGNVEFVLLGKSGKGVSRVRKDISQVVIESRQNHSRKPDEVNLRIQELFGEVPRIEIFATREIDGWDCIGDAINSHDIRDDVNMIVANKNF